MSDHRDPHPSPDVSLLLRAHAEQRWLSREVIPVLRELRTPERLPEEQLGAALAYLEVIWIEAMRRARETDAAHGHLEEPCLTERVLLGKACRYYTAVRTLREVVARQVEPLVNVSHDPSAPVSARAERA